MTNDNNDRFYWCRQYGLGLVGGLLAVASSAKKLLLADAQAQQLQVLKSKDCLLPQIMPMWLSVPMFCFSR
jgi:hypothetical protein